ncbi:response regulator [Micromonospora sp. NPDC003944]
MGDRLTTAVLIEDHAGMREGIRKWCAEADPPIDLVEAGGQVALAWTGPGRSADVVILDLLVEGKNQFDTITRLVESRRHVVVYTMYEGEETAVQCIDRGALAYIAKSEEKDHLIRAVRAAAIGETYTTPKLGGAILVDPKQPRLSEREKEALLLWLQLDSKAEVARKMFVTESTVDEFITRVRVKYDYVGRRASTKSELTVRAIKDGLITIEELEALLDRRDS